MNKISLKGKIRAAVCGLVFMGAGIGAVSAQEDHILCSVYGKISQATVDFMMPLTLEQVTGMMTGQNPGLLSKFVDIMAGSITVREQRALAAMPQSDVNLLSEYAGQITMQKVMSMQIRDRSRTRELMEKECKTIGAKTLIARLKKAKAALKGQ